MWCLTTLVRHRLVRVRIRLLICLSRDVQKSVDTRLYSISDIVNTV